MQIFIDNLQLKTIVGVYAHEQIEPQTLRFDIEMGLLDEAAAQSDKLADTLDYAAVAQAVERLLGTVRFKLLERLAGFLCAELAVLFPCAYIKLRVAKLGVVPNSAAVGVTLHYTPKSL
jgi:7,8-dihydroneopterin aldolase/epimerase/oxygenase